MTPTEKYAVFPWGNVNPSVMDQRVTAILRDIAQLRVDVQHAEPGDPNFVMHNNLRAELGNLGVEAEWLLNDERSFRERSASAVLPGTPTA